MKKVSTWVLMLCLVLSEAWSYAHDVARTEKGKDGRIPIELIEGATYSSSEKANSIYASVDGHTLSVVFLENLGQVNVEVVSVAGWEVATRMSPTPNGVDIYIANTGSYIVYFTLSNGDVFYGEFEVTD